MLNLQQFRVLLAIRENGSLTRAAEALRYGVPTVTHHLNALEAHLGTALVERARGGARLTPLGEYFADEIEPVLARIDRAERSLVERRDAGLATLRIGTFASLGSRLLPAAIAALQRRSPVRIEAIEAEPREVVRLLRNGDVDAGLIYDTSAEPAFDAPDLALHPLLSEPYRVMLAASSPWAEHAELDFADLSEVAWVCSRSGDEASDRVLQRTSQAVGGEIRELMRTDDLYMIHGLVAEGLGFALTTEAAVDADFDVVLRPAAQDLGERRVSFVTRSGPVPAVVRWLGRILQARTHDGDEGGSSG
ncbi:LysR family transcriptional regulator [Leucobacter soli]